MQADDGEALTRRELACVAAEATTPGISEESLYLNDSVINFYLVLVRRRLRNPRIVIFSTFMFQSLTRTDDALVYDFSKVKRWSLWERGKQLTGNAECGAIDRVFVPINIPEFPKHWVFVIVDNRQQTIKYFDSFMHAGRPQYFERHTANVRRYIDDQRRAYAQASSSSRQLALFDFASHHYDASIAECPAQRNGFDCGLFMLKMIAHELTNASSACDFAQGDMPAVREQFLLGLATIQPPWL